MTIYFTVGQLEKLSTLFLNIAQTLFIITFAVSFFADQTELIDAFKAFMIGIAFMYLSLETEKAKGGEKK